MVCHDPNSLIEYLHRGGICRHLVPGLNELKLASCYFRQWSCFHSIVKRIFGKLLNCLKQDMQIVRVFNQLVWSWLHKASFQKKSPWPSNPSTTEGLQEFVQNFDCSFMSATIDYVSCCPEMKTNYVVMGISGQTPAAETADQSCGLCCLQRELLSIPF